MVESEKHRAYREELATNTARVMARCHKLCERCGIADADLVHHRLRRSQGGGNELSNLAGLCSPCHRTIHDNPARSYREGWLVKSRGQGREKRLQ